MYFYIQNFDILLSLYFFSLGCTFIQKNRYENLLSIYLIIKNLSLSSSKDNNSYRFDVFIVGQSEKNLLQSKKRKRKVNEIFTHILISIMELFYE